MAQKEKEERPSDRKLQDQTALSKSCCASREKMEERIGLFIRAVRQGTALGPSSHCSIK